jgi:alkanesulfonate monooxygenase SsuD/methylene tetrahydromethanopterin reductase-like flavin-dependent oxidoreductase (luciferase family)
VRLGCFMMPLHPPARSYTDVLREDREALILADRLGYEEAFVGEHVTDAAEPVTSSLMFLASLKDQTRRMKLGSGTVNLPNNHPAQVAAQVAMIDHLLEGRFLFGISPGGLLSDAEIFGNLDKDRTEMFVEAIDHVLAIWSGEPPYDRHGKHWSFSTARTMRVELGQGAIVKPYQRPHPPIVVTAVAPFSKGVTAAAQRGWTPISANFLQPPWVASHWPKYVEGCTLAGRAASSADWRVAKSIFVADDAATAERYGKGHDGPYGYYFHSLMTKLIGNGRPELFKGDLAMRDEDVTLDYVLDSLVVAGTVDSVVEQLLAFRRTVGDFGTLLYALHDWVDPALGKRSMELMATEVMPRLNAAIAAETPVVAPGARA